MTHIYIYISGQKDNISSTETSLKEGDFPSLATFSGEVVWGRYNLTYIVACYCINIFIYLCSAVLTEPPPQRAPREVISQDVEGTLAAGMPSPPWNRRPYWRGYCWWFRNPANHFLMSKTFKNPVNNRSAGLQNHQQLFLDINYPKQIHV